MSQYPTAVDNASTLYVPVDKLGAATLTTTTTALAGSGDTTIAVASTDVGFPSANNLIVIGSELISYTGKTATTFTGCTRGVGNTVASAHAAGSVVIAPMSAEYILALQSAVIALQNTVGVEGAYLFQLAAEAVYAASQISFAPAGIIAATNVQAAIEEVANESARTSHTHAAGDIASGTLADARVAASNVTQHQAALSVATSQLTGTLPDARVAQSNVTQHQAALAIAQSQVTGLTAALAGKSAVGHVHDTADITTGTLADARVGASSVTQHQAALSIATSQLTGTLADARVAASNVTQHQAALAIAQSQVTGLVTALAGKAASSHVHDTADITTGTLADARVAQSNVTQHQAALTIAESQVTGLTAALAAKAPLASPTLTGSPTAPTVATNSDSTAIATTAWVRLQNYLTSVGSHTHAAGDITSGTFDKDRIPETLNAIVVPTVSFTGGTGNQSYIQKETGGNTIDLKAGLGGFRVLNNAGTAARFVVLDNGTVYLNGEATAPSATIDTTNAGNITSGTIPAARIGASSVTQHQAALTIAESQVTGLTAALAGKSAVGHTHAASDIASGTLADARVAQSNVTQHQAALSIAASQLTGTLADARVAQSNVTQHESALTIAQSQVTGLTAALAGKSAVGHVHDGADITTGKIPLDRVSEVLALSDLSDVSGSTGTGNVVRATSPTIVTPVIASFASAAHGHQDAAGGGTLDGAAIATGTVSRDRLQTMVGAVADPATDGVKGAVPAPTSAEVQYFLAGDGNWRSAIHRVTFVGPDLMTVTGSPATSYLSTIGLQWNAQVKNKVVASPASGADGIPTCRALVSDDIPNLAGEKIASGTVANARLVNAGVLTITVGDGMLGGGDVAIGGTVSINAKVRKVFGRTGDVAQEAGDYTTAQIANTSVISGSTLNEAIANLDYLKAGTSVTSDLQSQINSISSNITSITNGLNAVGSDVQTLIAQVAALENGYAALANSVDILEGNVSDINAELTDIWNTLASKASVDHTH